jgi:two-component system chemotaxis response regulator CheB
VVVGASAGGVEALKRFVDALPEDLPASLCVTIHLADGTQSMLPGILGGRAAIRVEPAVDDAPLVPGVVHVGQPDSHIVVVEDRIVLSKAARENGNRLSIDVPRGNRSVGAVLTGMLDDGTVGLATIARYGGAAPVQDPAKADFPSLPRR